jgi:hypothetical protein
MPLFKESLQRLTETKYAGYILVLFVFFILRLLSVFSFYNGFLGNFETIATLFPSDGCIGRTMEYVPYHSWSVCLAALLHPVFLITLIFIYFPLAYKKRFLLLARDTFPASDRIMIFISAFILSWELCTYDYNYYLDSAFYFDRFILILLPFLIIRYPVTIPLYVAFAFVYRSQFNYPVDGFDLFDKRLLFDILLMFTALIYVKLYFPKIRMPFFFFVMCIVASNYFMSGAIKIVMSPHGYEWLRYNKISDLFINVHARGWLAGYDPDFIQKCWRFLETNNVLLQSLILILELAAVFLFRNIKFAITLLVLLSLMHLGIFLAGSMLFWKWIVIDLSLAVLLWKYKVRFKEFFSGRMVLISCVIILSSVIWLKPYTIGWFDTPYNQYFTYEAEDENGNMAEVGKNELNPYHQWFQYDKFLFLVDKTCLQMSGFGYVKKYVLKKQLDTIPPSRLPFVEEEFGKNTYRAEQSEAFNDFIATFFKNRNRRSEQLFLTIFHPPHHLYNRPSGKGLGSLGKIKKFRVIYNISHNENGRVVPVEREIIDEIII